MEQQDLQCSMQAVEQSCAALHVSDPGIRSSAEATLLAFRKSPHPFYACQYILENSQVATAKFLAAATIQEAAIREWTLISPEEKSRLRSYCLQYVMARVETSEGYILSKILSVVAALLKRWSTLRLRRLLFLKRLSRLSPEDTVLLPSGLASHYLKHWCPNSRSPPQVRWASLRSFMINVVLLWRRAIYNYGGKQSA
ncbi:uncharacterized protein LOC9654131 isoform X7 [Selaginella moellendorffii]|uniref:uncharacterized protein LOC9654131 isoform X7 n=1 Tax=Selaginella moellendorffii TaxID=88036 RepID=UPI000D1C8C5E|nr:uncharacterized protein LOC9654131 isoform X7 [Selaginella moellendorffii]|eukprot:XP_024524931.1 uncharacterized protein LOC9654131 isoform X7 [Selaginella moellendorffii]